MSSFKSPEELEGVKIMRDALRRHAPELPEVLFIVKFNEDLGKFGAEETYFMPKSSYLRCKDKLTVVREISNWSDVNPTEDYEFITYPEVLAETQPEVKKIQDEALMPSEDDRQ